MRTVWRYWCLTTTTARTLTSATPLLLMRQLKVPELRGVREPYIHRVRFAGVQVHVDHSRIPLSVLTVVPATGGVPSLYATP